MARKATAKRGGEYLDRATVVRVAADLADAEGWDKLTLSRVADEVGRHVTSLYAHVASVEALRREVALTAMAELSDAVWKAALGRTQDDALAAIATVYRDFALEHPGRTAAMHAVDHRHDDEVRELGLRLAEPIYATFRSYGLDDAQVVHAHRIFSSAVRGLALAEANDTFAADGRLDDTFDDMILLFSTALASGAWPRRRAGRRRSGR